MSQVNKFKQDQNPDFLYFDLQQTNVYNTTENIQQPLKFVETRDNPIVANSGDYHLSVTRFQLDTYNLPVLVVEPDLTQTGNYDPNQTIYKVALIPKKSHIKSQVQSLSTQILIENIPSNTSTYGARVAFQPNTATYSVVIGDASGDSGRGRLIYGLSTDNINVSRQAFTAPNIANLTEIGASSAGISEDSQFLISNGTNGTNDYTFVWSRANSPTSPYILTFDSGEGGPSQISGDGTKIIVGRLVGQSADVISYKFNRATGAFTQWAQIFSSRFSEAAEPIGLRGIGMSNNGVDVVVSNIYYEGPGAGERGAVIFIKMDYANAGSPYSIVKTIEGDYSEEHLGHYVCMSANGLVVAISAPNNSSPYIKIYNKTTAGGVTDWNLGQTLTGGQVELGDRMSLSADGTYLYVATNSTHRVKRFKKTSGTYAYELTMAQFAANNVNVASNSTGLAALIVDYGATGNEEFIGTTQINIGDTFNLPPSTENIPVIKPVIWTPDYKDADVPNKNVLTGKNTAFYQYYYCNAYENFIARVNVAIRTAYIALIEELYNDWVVPTGNASLTNVFIDIVLRQYAPPPFLEWNEAELKAELYATLLFQTHNPPPNDANEIPVNYSSYPDVVWSVVSTNRVGTPGLITPLEFQIAMNAPLYSLFNSLPASKKVLTAPISLYKENYYILNFFTTGNDLATPSVPLHTAPSYSFTGNYDVSGNIQYPSQYTANITHSNLLIKQPQELSTIDTWTPINAIVFTTTSLPIVVNQFSASSSIGDKPPSGSTSNEFAFIITDIQSNDQGFRPNILYAPSAQFRYIDLTGNQPIKNIDISIFWRTTTGALIPMVLASGAQASIKLLFEKKDKSGQKEANGFIIDKGSGFSSSI